MKRCLDCHTTWDSGADIGTDLDDRPRAAIGAIVPATEDFVHRPHVVTAEQRGGHNTVGCADLACVRVVASAQQVPSEILAGARVEPSHAQQRNKAVATKDLSRNHRGEAAAEHGRVRLAQPASVPAPR
jgi:hypothetical protein